MILLLLSIYSPLSPTASSTPDDNNRFQVAHIDNLYTTPTGSVISYSYACKETAFFDRQLDTSYIDTTRTLELDRDTEFTTILSIK